jgi:hypothetical protein
LTYFLDCRVAESRRSPGLRLLAMTRDGGAMVEPMLKADVFLYVYPACAFANLAFPPSLRARAKQSTVLDVLSWIAASPKAAVRPACASS